MSGDQLRLRVQRKLTLYQRFFFVGHNKEHKPQLESTQEKPLAPRVTETYLKMFLILTQTFYLKYQIKTPIHSKRG